MIKHAHNEFKSDLFLLLETVGATLTIIDAVNRETIVVSVLSFLSVNMSQKILTTIKLPRKDPKLILLRSYKVRDFKIVGTVFIEF